MAKFDQGGGCACGLQRTCDCASNSQADGSKPNLYAAHEARNKDYFVPLEFDETPESIVEWARETFGGQPNALKIAARANKEMAELLMALAEREALWYNETSTGPESVKFHELTEKIKEEVADIIIVAMQLPPLLGFNLQKKINEKMQINRKRRWERTDDGSYQHIKE